MPPQHVEIAETVAALRRKLRRDKEATSNSAASTTQTTQFASNRGNKLKPGVRYVHVGSLPYRNNSSGYRERINHAGYSRHILERNPPRTNEYGDELDDSESDLEADADAEDENPYADVRLEELLRPLTHPSELANHPAMAQAYLDPALPDMLVTTEAKIREERNSLWRAKNLYRHFIGDESWIPCERAENSTDWYLFEPNPSSDGRLPTGESPSKRRRLEAVDLPNGDTNGDTQAPGALDRKHESGAILNTTIQDLGDHLNGDRVAEGEREEGPTDVTMGGTEEPKTNGIHKTDETETVNATPTEKAMLQDQSRESEMAEANPQEDNPTLNEAESQPNTNDNDTVPKEEEDDNNNNENSSPISTPPLPTRRITRALAAEEATPQIASPPPTSPTLSIHSPSLLEPHPLFLLPPSLATYHAPHSSHPLPLHLAHSGLPPDELLETRKLLSLYIQKSEETIRGLESIYAKLFKAKRRRDQVWEWCIAEGHVGEMSDGEDWIDVDKWGLTRDELRKGRDEDNGGDVAANGEDEGGTTGGGGGVVMGGRKGKRRRAAAGAKDKEKEKEKE